MTEVLYAEPEGEERIGGHLPVVITLGETAVSRNVAETVVRAVKTPDKISGFQSAVPAIDNDPEDSPIRDPSQF